MEGDLGNLGVSSRVKAAVSYYGIADLRRLAAERVERREPPAEQPKRARRLQAVGDAQ